MSDIFTLRKPRLYKMATIVFFELFIRYLDKSKSQVNGAILFFKNSPPCI